MRSRRSSGSVITLFLKTGPTGRLAGSDEPRGFDRPALRRASGAGSAPGEGRGASPDLSAGGPSGAAAAQGVLLPARRAVGLTATVARASAGAIEHLPVARVVNVAQTIERLKAANFWVYGLDANGTRSYWEVDYRGPVALVVGG